MTRIDQSTLQLQRNVASVFSRLEGKTIAPRDIQEIVGLGSRSRVFESTESRLILRLGAGAGHLMEYRREELPMHLARVHGLPVPEVIENGFLPNGLAFNVQTRMPGMAPTRFLGEKNRIWRQLGELAKIIHSIRSDQLTGVVPEERDQFEVALKDFAASKLSDPYGTELKLLSQFVTELASNRPRKILIHGNLLLRNILVSDRGTITAILRWGMAGLGTRIPDLSRTLGPQSLTEQTEFLKGYGVNQADVNSLMARIASYHALRMLSHLQSTAASENNPAVLGRAMFGFEEAFSKLRNLYSSSRKS